MHNIKREPDESSFAFHRGDVRHPGIAASSNFISDRKEPLQHHGTWDVNSIPPSANYQTYPNTFLDVNWYPSSPGRPYVDSVSPVGGSSAPSQWPSEIYGTDSYTNQFYSNPSAGSAGSAFAQGSHSEWVQQGPSHSRIQNFANQTPLKDEAVQSPTFQPVQSAHWPPWSRSGEEMVFESAPSEFHSSSQAYTSPVKSSGYSQRIITHRDSSILPDASVIRQRLEGRSAVHDLPATSYQSEQHQHSQLFLPPLPSESAMPVDDFRAYHAHHSSLPRATAEPQMPTSLASPSDPSRDHTSLNQRRLQSNVLSLSPMLTEQNAPRRIPIEYVCSIICEKCQNLTHAMTMLSLPTVAGYCYCVVCVHRDIPTLLEPHFDAQLSESCHQTPPPKPL